MFSNIQNAEHLDGLGNIPLLRDHSIHAPIPPKVNNEVLRLPQTMGMMLKDKMNILGHLEARTSAIIEEEPVFKKVAQLQKLKEIRVMTQPIKNEDHVLRTWFRNRKLSGHSFPFIVSLNLISMLLITRKDNISTYSISSKLNMQFDN